MGGFDAISDPKLRAYVQQVAAEYGEADQIDDKYEKQQLSAFLQARGDKISPQDRAIIEGLCVEHEDTDDVHTPTPVGNTNPPNNDNKDKKYEKTVYINMMPGPNQDNDVKSKVISALKGIGMGQAFINEALKSDDIIAFCKKHGIDVQAAF